MLTKPGQRSKEQQALLDGWTHFVDDYDALKSLYADDVKITNCYAPQPCEEHVGFDAAYASFRPLIAQFTMAAAPVTTTNNMFVWTWTDFVVTTINGGCTAVFSGVATTKFHPDTGLIEEFMCMSDNMQPLFDCLAEYMDGSANHDAKDI